MNYITKKIILAVAAIVIALSLPAAVLAAGMDSPFAIDNIPNVIGVGVAMLPDYLGSDDYTVGAAPMFRWTLSGSERYLQILVTELSFNVITTLILCSHR